MQNYEQKVDPEISSSLTRKGDCGVEWVEYTVRNGEDGGGEDAGASVRKAGGEGIRFAVDKNRTVVGWWAGALALLNRNCCQF